MRPLPETAPGPAGLPSLLDVAAVAAWLGCTPATVRSMAKRRELPSLKVAGAWRFTSAALAEWLANEQVPPRRPPYRGNGGGRRVRRHR